MSDLDLLRAADPAGSALPLDGRHDLLARLRQLAPEEEAGRRDRAPPGGVPTRARGAGQRPRLAAAAAVVALALTGSVAWQVAGTGQPGGATPAAAAVLGQASAATVGAQDPVVGPGQYLKVTSTEVASVSVPVAPGVAVAYLEQQTREVWMPADPAGEWVERRSQGVPVKFFRPQDEQLARDAGLLGIASPAELLRARGGTFSGADAGSWGTPTPAFLAALPRQPDDLLATVYRRTAGAGTSADGEALVAISDVLRCGYVPADLRAALFQAAKGIPGVDVVDRRANLDGRVGVAVGRDERANGNHFRQELIFDPRTGQVIGERRVELDGDEKVGIPAGEVVGASSVEKAVVDSAP